MASVCEPAFQNKYIFNPKTSQSFYDLLLENKVGKRNSLSPNIVVEDADLKSLETFTCLTQACLSGSLKYVEIFVQNGVDVNSFNEKGTPLVALCKSASKNEDDLLQCMTLLINLGADVNLCDVNGVSPLSHAVINNHEKLIIKLINEGADTDREDVEGWTPIFYAVGTNKIHFVCLLKDYKADIFAVDKRGRTLVDIALEIDNKDMIELLNGCCDTDTWFARFKHSEKRPSNMLQRLYEILPNKEDRLCGFTSEIDYILSAVELNHLKKHFHDKKIGLGRLLTSNENELKALGVNFWFERRKLFSAIQKFHEYPWNTSSFNISSSFQELDLQIVQLLGTIVRQLYLISVSSNFWIKCGGIEKTDKTINQTLVNSFKTLSLSKVKLLQLKNTFKSLGDESIASDFIQPSFEPKINYFSPLLLLAFSSFVLYQNNFFQKLLSFTKKIIC